MTPEEALQMIAATSRQAALLLRDQEYRERCDELAEACTREVSSMRRDAVPVEDRFRLRLVSS